MLTTWWCHPYPSQSCESVRLVFGSGQPIRAKKTRGMRLRAWPACSSAHAAMSDVRFWRGFHQCAHLFLLYIVVWSKHNFDNFYFLAKSNTTLNHMLWYQLLGNPTGDVLIFAHWRLSTLTQYLTWFGKSSISMVEVHIIRDREMIQYKYMEEEDHIHSNSTPSSHCCPCSSSLFLSILLHTLTALSLSLILLSNNASIYWHFMADNRSSIMAQMMATHGLHYFYRWWVQLPL